MDSETKNVLVYLALVLFVVVIILFVVPDNAKQRCCQPQECIDIGCRTGLNCSGMCSITSNTTTTHPMTTYPTTTTTRMYDLQHVKCFDVQLNEYVPCNVSYNKDTLFIYYPTCVNSQQD
jgi:hypothetical protein